MARTTRSPEERRAEIIAAATKLFMEQGYESTSVSDIVRAVGVAQGTFYWHFKSKEEVLNAVTSSIADEICGSIIRLAGQQDLGAVDKFKAFGQAVLGLMALKDPIGHFHRTENRAFHDELHHNVVKLLRPSVAGVIAQGVEEGVFRVDSPDRAAALVLGTFNGLPEELVQAGDEEIGVWMTELVTFVLRGLGYH